ncbi:SAM-dependent methyltransferase [Actinoalloteichus hoggarensis]|uniref:Carminomycin 4-O-methyltransferase n=1 Tax=Actinoalloteichus hoggarensis TaxID=1470176 RepID=A0A221W1M1_9PSEU|nr:methyltransferase [Actinoalloteichus hoggarensis]ASO19694.1 Carminomycin 4-O-methyltransferase [Actinoalloteichus hoggarensis]MBB5919599.1 SAM-dependent methyltransferase [Actinoalloteichus hoggarensis]
MTTHLEPVTRPHPRHFLDKAMAFQPSKMVLAGLEVGLFDLLAEAPATESVIRERLGLHPRGTGHFLDALAALGMLNRDGDVFSNSQAAEFFLVPTHDEYMGGLLHMANRVMYPAWGRLAEALRTGRPQAATYTGDTMFEQLYENDEKRVDFIGMAEAASKPLIPALIERFDWSDRTLVVELGGCRGNVLAQLVRAHPHLDGTVLDLPQLRPAFDEHMAALGTTGTVRFEGGDFFESIPEAEVMMIGHSLIDWEDAQRRRLLANAFAALKPGGAFLIWDPIIVEGEEGYLRNLVTSLNLQLMTPHGTGYRLQECVEWLTDAGFATVTHLSLGHDVTLVIGHKAP